MNPNACQSIREALDALAEGRFDAVSDEQMERVERHLGECADCSARLAGVTACPEADFVEVPPSPTQEEWDDVWQAVDAATSAKPRLIEPVSPWAGRWGRWVTAAAAGLALTVALWRLPLPGRSPNFELRLAHADDVQIESLSVYGEATPFVLSVGDEEDAIPIIWVIEDQES
jgi:hypothetical protein